MTSKDDYHALLRDLLAGNFEAHRIGRDKLKFNSPNQTDRYDPVPFKENRLIDTGELGYKQMRAEIQRAREVFGFHEGHASPAVPGPWQWRATELTPNTTNAHRWNADAGQRDASGAIYVTSSRAEWFGEAITHMSIVRWCLANGHRVDLVVDPLEAGYYAQHVLTPANLAELAYSTGRTEAEIVEGLSIVTLNLDATSAELRKWPRGFGFNRYIGMECMKRRFRQGRCLTIDDNTAWFVGKKTSEVLAGMLAPENGVVPALRSGGRALGAGDWLAVSFKPCTVAPGDRAAIHSNALANGAFVGAFQINVAQNDDRIIQQLTLWNTAQVIASGINYDPRFLTGKEDVELFGRLKSDRALAGKIFRCNDLTLGKCSSKPDGSNHGSVARRKTLLERIRDQNDALLGEARCKDILEDRAIDGTLYWLSEKKYHAQLCRLAYAYTVDNERVDSETYFWTRDSVWPRYAALLENQNKLLEQFLVPSV